MKITENQKALVSYIIDRLRQFGDISPDLESSLRVAENSLELNLSVTTNLPLALQEKLNEFWEVENDSPIECGSNHKLYEFIDLLKARGYFKGVEPDSEEYKVRMKKAINKYTAKQNPFANMTPEEIKAKGNTNMIAGKFSDAIQCYTKAIELTIESEEDETSPQSSQLHIYYANRAAAQIEMKNYSQATEDCAKSISYKPDYPKAFARLGVAHYYLNEFDKSATAYERALELDCGNEKYRQDMEDARLKAKETESTSKANLLQNLMGDGGGNLAESMSSLLGDNSQMKEMLQSLGNISGDNGSIQNAMANMASNPQFMDLAQSFMKNPQFSNMVQGFAQDFMKGSRNQGGQVPDLSSVQNLFNPTLAGIDSDAIRELRESDIHTNPKMRDIAEEVRQHGPGVFTKYMNDPDVMGLMQKFGEIIKKSDTSN